MFAPARGRQVELRPITVDEAVRVLADDTGDIASAPDWPHPDTTDGLGLAVAHGHPPGWFVLVDGIVIGDGGTHGPPDPDGVVEIGYGLAASVRGRGHGSDLVATMARSLLDRPEVTCVRASTDLDNLPSRRALESAGFACVAEDASGARYELR